MSNVLKPTIQPEGKLKLHVSGGLMGGWQDWELDLASQKQDVAALMAEMAQKAFDDYHANRVHYSRRLKTISTRTRDGTSVSFDYTDMTGKSHKFSIAGDDMAPPMQQLAQAVQQRGTEVKPDFTRNSERGA